jgi:UDP-glucose 4-epimerase
LDSVFAKYAQQGGIHAVIHLAALKAVGESGEKPGEYYGANVGGSLALLDVGNSSRRNADVQTMQRHGCKQLVFSSSATVHGIPETIPIPESSPVDPKSVYGRTKGMVEHIIQDICVADANRLGEDGLRAISVRYFK